MRLHNGFPWISARPEAIWTSIGFVLVALIVALPVAHVLYLQGGSDLRYMPNHLNHHWEKFDDIVKLYPAFHLARDGELSGKLGSMEYQDKMFPSVIQELAGTLIHALAIKSLGTENAPYFVLGLLVAMSYLVGVKLLGEWGVPWPLAIPLSLVMIFGYFFLFPERWHFSFLTHPWQDAQAIHRWVGQLVSEYNSFYRIHTLGATYFLFLSYVYLLTKAFAGALRKKWHWAVLALLLAVQFYAYFFYSLAAVALHMALAGMAGFLWYVRGRGEYATVCKGLFVTGIIAIAVALPSIGNTLQLMTADSKDWVTRIGGDVSTPKAFWAITEVAVMGGLLLLASPPGAFRVITVTLVLETLLLENLQVLVGFNIQPGHFYHRTCMPLFVLLGGASLVHASRVISTKVAGRLGKKDLGGGEYILAGIPIGLAALFFVGEGIYYGISNPRHVYIQQSMDSNQAAIIEWFQGQKGKPLVATLTPELATPLNIYAPIRLYLNFAGHLYSTVTQETLYERLGILFWLYGAGLSEVEDYFSVSGSETEKRYLYYYFQRYFEPYRDEPFGPAAEKISNYIDKVDRDPARMLCGTGIQYLLVGGKGEKQSGLKEIRRNVLDQVYQAGPYRIYRLTPERLGCRSDNR